MTKTFWAIIAIIIVIFGGILAFHNNKTGSSGSGTPTNHVEGGGSTGVTLVEYGDYECPYCSQYYTTVKQVFSQYSSQIYFQFRNLPLSQVHPNAFAGARAAEAAGLQGKFWEMHDLLYENQSSWSTASGDVSPILASYAQQLGLNVTQFKSDYASLKVDNLINADLAAFNKTGEVEATPTFFLDGKKVSPDNTFAAFQKLIDAEIKTKTANKPAATPSTTTTTTTPDTSKQ